MTPGFNRDEIHAHFALMHDRARQANVDGKLVLSCYGEDPTTGRKTSSSVQHFAIGDVDLMTGVVAAMESEPHRNVYAGWHVMRPDLPRGERGGTADIRVVLAFAVDQDGDTGKAHGELPFPAPYILETSAGNQQPVLIPSQALAPAEAHPLAKALQKMTGADSGTGDIAHVWRVPGTLNWPNKKKLERGRPLAPQPVNVLKPWNGETIDVDDLRARLEPYIGTASSSQQEQRGTGDRVALLDRLKRRLGSAEVLGWLDLVCLDKDGGDRSRHACRVIGRLMDFGFSDTDICTLMWSAPCAESYSNEKHLRDDIARLRAKRPPEGVALPPGLVEFYAYMPNHSYIFTPTRDLWPAISVNSRIPPIDTGNKDDKDRPKLIQANAWLDKHQSVEQVTWSPGLPMIVRDRLVTEGGWISAPGKSCFNLYRPPNVEVGDPSDAGLWGAHIRHVFPESFDHIILFLAHRVQRPAEKINHALVLGGNQGIGKDALLEPVKYAVGPWNFLEVSPQQLLGRFNGFVKSVVLRVSEARNLGDLNRYAFYEHMKTLTASPPDVLRVDEKHLREHSVFNCTSVIITTNHKANGIHIPDDDRRHYVAWSHLTKETFEPEYWANLFGWYERGGLRSVASYLKALDISRFKPKDPPPKTQAWWEIVDAGRSPEDASLADAIDRLGRPWALTLEQVALHMPEEDRDWFRDKANRRNIPHRFEACGYTTVRNTTAKDGLWVIAGRRQAVYGRCDISERERHSAAAGVVRQARQ